MKRDPQIKNVLSSIKKKSISVIFDLFLIIRIQEIILMEQVLKRARHRATENLYNRRASRNLTQVSCEAEQLDRRLTTLLESSQRILLKL